MGLQQDGGDTREPSHMETKLPLRIVLVAPPVGVDFGLQDGKGSNYTTILKQRSSGADLIFDCEVTVRDNCDDGQPNFLGPLTQGPPTARFIYVDLGKLAGQPDSCWERRIKVPLTGISWDDIQQVSATPKLVLEAHLPGTGKDGGPSCGTVQPTQSWSCRSRKT